MFDAVVLAGGRASRLGGYPKPQLEYRGATLLEHALRAVARARTVVVVGPAPGEPGGPALPGRAGTESACPEGRKPEAHEGRLDFPPSVLFTREEPRFAGPLAALGAGLAALRARAALDSRAAVGYQAASDSQMEPQPEWVVVLAADLPLATGGVAQLLARAAALDRAAAPDPAAASPGPDAPPGPDALLGTDAGGRAQPLLAAYRRGPLEKVLARLAAEGGLADRPMKHLVARLDMLPLALPPRASDDVDTWEAALSWGIERPGPGEGRDATPRQEERHD
ncbi:NTP transferase domain-containing protein [Sinomonas sp. JC656]|uniref:NTP transferase domain-containing protein n=1 Tax=Sinomonas cellulolyticus TaxID=2801916 RepID=A0ABS1K014_9MICC|nr:NTP transferase domain-containing protein [Sinomonas cellulolyticus]